MTTSQLNGLQSDKKGTLSMSTVRAVDVFMPSDFPTLTYVSWDREQLEKRLRDALETPGEVVSVSGPSKSGKTVLVEKVVGRDNLIAITGAGIRTPDQLWDRVLDWIEVPQSQTITTQAGVSGAASASATGEVGIPLVTKGSVEGKLDVGISGSRSDAKTAHRRGLTQVVKEISDSDFVLLIDDFHYMERSIQTEVAKQIKEAARTGQDMYCLSTS
jgi:hypothetical protein